MTPAFSLIVETYTVSEGGDRGRFGRVLGVAARIAGEAGGELLVPVVSDAPGLDEALRESAPLARRIDARGLDYDSAKMLAAREARAPFVAYLDGDCEPAPGWLEALLDPLRRGTATAAGGYTRYEGGFLSAVASLLDFGFLEPAVERELACYASNNCAFVREALLAEPIPPGPLRCRCFLHSQNLRRRGKPVRLAPEARVLHETQPLLRERTRQGYDLVAACWADPSLWEARLVRLGVLALPALYAFQVGLDLRRLASSRLALPQKVAALAFLPALRTLDALGVLRALWRGPEAAGAWSGWGGTQSAPGPGRV